MLTRVGASSLIEGKVLARDIYSPNGQLLLHQGTVLKPAHLKKLNQMGCQDIYIYQDEADSMIPDNEPDKFAFGSENEETLLPHVFNYAAEHLREMMQGIEAGHSVRKTEVEETFNLLYPEVMNTNNVIRCLGNLRKKDEYTLQHSVSVSVIAIKIGQVMGLTSVELKEIGIAGLLHDIGKCKIPLDILNKPGALSREEFKEIQKHPVYGYQVVSKIPFLDTNIMMAVLQHHEHQDGKGYPLHTIGRNIHIYSSIVAVADVFDALTSDRVYRPRMSLLQAAAEIVRNSCGHLEPHVTQQFFDYLSAVAPGETVLLNTGEEATVIMMNKNEPVCPLVMVGDRFIDLNVVRDIYIQEPTA